MSILSTPAREMTKSYPSTNLVSPSFVLDHELEQLFDDRCRLLRVSFLFLGFEINERNPKSICIPRSPFYNTS
jgi:hypothetical protein